MPWSPDGYQRRVSPVQGPGQAAPSPGPDAQQTELEAALSSQPADSQSQEQSRTPARITYAVIFGMLASGAVWGANTVSEGALMDKVRGVLPHSSGGNASGAHPNISPTSPVPTPTPSPSEVRLTQNQCIRALPITVKLGQKLMPGVVKAAELKTDARPFEAAHIGSILMMDMLSKPYDGSIKEFKKTQTIPPLVYIDQEGGQVQRLKTPKGGLLPDAATIGKVKPTAARLGAIEKLFAKNYGDWKAIGGDGVLAPVADVAPIKGINVLDNRILSGDPAVVEAYIVAEVAAADQAGIKATLKHFPGAGSATENTDLHPATTAPYSALKIRDLLPYENPFLQDVATGANVMVGNQIVPGLTAKRPASESPAAYAAVRGLGYENAILFTDDLGAAAIPESADRAVVNAWEAGDDIALLVTPDKGLTWQTQIAAIVKRAKQQMKAGKLTNKQLNESVGRVFAQKLDAAGAPFDACSLLPEKQQYRTVTPSSSATASASPTVKSTSPAIKPTATNTSK